MLPHIVRRFATAACVLAGLALPATPAVAQQFTIEPDVNCSEDDGFSYRGPFVIDGSVDDECGSVSDGGEDAFDDFGNPVGYRRLQVTRRTEVFPRLNLVRWYDTYTNTSANTIRALVGLSGDLGSDSDTQVRLFDADFIITADEDPTDPDQDYGNDPVLAFVFGNNVFSRMNFAADLPSVDEPEEFFMGGPVTFAPGQSISLLFFAFQAYTVDRDSREEQLADEQLAIARAQDLVANPYLAGLSNEQRLRVANFDVTLASSVPEPSTWALLGTGLLAIGGVAARRRKR